MDNKFDERYPAIFQPGGDGLPRAAETRSPPVQLAVPLHPQVPVGQPSLMQPGPIGRPGPIGQPLVLAEPGLGTRMPAAPVAEQDAVGQAATGAEPPGLVPGYGPQAAGTSAPWPALRWLVPLGAAVAMLAAGAFSLTAQYWVAASMELDPSKFHGIELQPWGQIIYQAAPALLGTGCGILAGLLFLASRRQAGLEGVLRTAFGLLALAVGVAGWTALFANVIFPSASNNSSAAYDGSPRQIPWTYVLMPCGTWLLAVALILLAVLFVVPPRWQRGRPDSDGAAENLPTGGRPSARRGLWFGAAAVAAAAFAMFAPYMVPLSTGIHTVVTEDGGSYSEQAWAAMAWFLATPLLLAGLGVLGWASVSVAIAPRTAGGGVPAGGDGPVELDGTGVGH